ncbi:hypothetical protein DACRYDRAFT_22311 [Dacryopinax primogenitus]|uniref:Secreted protein n=1 Tax=Dacryopinax primogenitus (strain DJM 731) TaxID=1858805 RepID=M5GCM8_DACPD|nr:uncharacterized protein DACRYDRAFT_22311 [Dacryopinax primogenitus]EJU01868.1 hypothetical protein DACRYDRAFT_22311 [Dacryopinax primogenitus]
MGGYRGRPLLCWSVGVLLCWRWRTTHACLFSVCVCRYTKSRPAAPISRLCGLVSSGPSSDQDRCTRSTARRRASIPKQELIYSSHA